MFPPNHISDVSEQMLQRILDRLPNATVGMKPSPQVKGQLHSVVPRLPSTSEICHLWRAALARGDDILLKISYSCGPSAPDGPSLRRFADLLKASEPNPIDVIVHIAALDSPNSRVVAVCEVAKLVMPHFSRLNRFEVIVSKELMANERALFFADPLRMCSRYFSKPLHLPVLKFLHLENVSISLASYLQGLLDNAPLLREALIHRNTGEIEPDYTVSTLSLPHLKHLLVDPDVLNIILGIGYTLPDLRSLAVPTNQGHVRWMKTNVIAFAKLKYLLVGGLQDDQLISLVMTTPLLERLFLQHCSAGRSFIAAMCTRRNLTGPYPVPMLDELRIEEGCLNDDDVSKLVGRRASPRSRRYVHELRKRPNRNFDVPPVEPGIQHIVLVDCKHTTTKSAYLLETRYIGLWNSKRD